MFKLHIIQAFHGDCLILEYGRSDSPRFALIDGGPGKTYDQHLKSELQAIRENGGKLDLVVLSHVDDDHVNGLLDLLNDLVEQRRAGQTELITIDGLWHNSFNQTLGSRLARGLTRQMGAAGLPRSLMPLADMQERSIRQGSELTALARGLQIPINTAFRDTPDRVVSLDNAPQPLTLANLQLQVVGPTQENLAALQEEWAEWLAKQEDAAGLPPEEAERAARALDKSVPNLSSIMLLVSGDNKTLLLTGDGRGDHLLSGLAAADLLDEEESLHVDIFKLPHHGSNRNISAEFFERVTADTYVICANGKHHNPDYQTLEWLVQAAQKQRRAFHLVVTNETASTRKLVKTFPPGTHNYTLTLLAPEANVLTLDLGPNQAGKDGGEGPIDPKLPGKHPVVPL